MASIDSTTPFGAQTGSSLFGGTSTGVFGQTQSSPFGASSSPAFGAAFGAPSSTQTSPFGGASGTSAFGAFGSSPAQTSPFGSTAQPSQPAFGSNMFGTTSTPFGASQPAFGTNAAPAFGSTNTTAFGSTNTTAFGGQGTPAFGTTSASPFGSTTTPAFGAPSTPTFVSTPSPTFGSTGSAFGTTSSNLFGSGGAFGASTTPAFGQSSSAFGTTTSAPALGQSSSVFGTTTSAPAFGQSSSGFGFSTSAPAFGQSSSTFGSTQFAASSPFGAQSSPSPFGAQSSPFGAQSTTPTLGNTAFGQSAFGGQRGGSRVTAYTGTSEPDSYGMGKLESISAMPAYKEKSHEELRWEDYQLGDKGGPSPATGFVVTSSSPFSLTSPFSSSSTQTNFFTPASSASPFGQTSSPAIFSLPSSFSFSIPATSSTPSFNFPTPSNPQTQFGQTGATSFWLDPSTFGSNLFNNTSSLHSSSLGTTSNQLGITQPAPDFPTFQTSQPLQTSPFGFSNTNTFNQPQPGNTSAFGGLAGISGQSNFGQSSVAQGSAAVQQPVPATNPVGTLPAMPQMSIAPYQKPDSGTTTSVTSITVNPTSGTAVTITPSPGSTVTITISTSGSTTINISPTSETTSSNTPSPTGETSSPFSFRLPHPAPESPSLFQPFNSLDKKPPAVQPIHSTSSSLLPTPVPAQPIEDGVRESIKNQNDVTLGITKQLLLDVGRDNNMVYSPLSVHVVLGLIAAGSTRGTNRDQILNFLKAKSTEELNDFASKLVPLVFADGSPKGGPCLSFTNSVWLDKSLSFKASFKQVVDTAYKAALGQVDFKTKAEDIRCEVNSWAKEETKGLIIEVLPPMSVDGTTRLILANALYFKGDWTEKFHTSLTKTDDFHLIDGRRSVKAPFMTSRNKQFISAFDGFKVLKLPYEQGGDHIRRFSMYVYLPNAIDGLPALVERVCSESGFVDRYLPCFAVKVGRFLIPKFKVSAGFEVKEVLQTLGLDLPFRPGSLSQMVDSSLGLGISCILHKSFIEVNEEGTEAAAVTFAFGLSDCISIRDPPIDFVADHPFLFLIREETSGAVLFIGHVLNPSADQ
ncbi:uncharacterized protein LOC133742978 isoform X2 [Rosa rugosa]|uniref:uncharacterized protein LOC133742978 isoform X2 n=1 Tax=Rosa rugosa TaxID=74645 RepID=UPI002B408650|nr:uncharacterized protein LOC133742978 isoform X2 [Rosa rugosa]